MQVIKFNIYSNLEFKVKYKTFINFEDIFLPFIYTYKT